MKINVEKLYSLDGHQDCVYSLEGGNMPYEFFSAGGDGMVAKWDLQNPNTGELIAKMKNSVYAIHYLKDKNLLVAGQNFEGIHLINPNEKREIKSLQISKSQIFDIKSHDGKLLIGSGDGTLYVVGMDSWAIVKKIKLSDKSIRTIVVNKQLGEMAIGLSDNTIRILDLDGYKQKYLIHAHKISVFDLAYNRINNHLISVSRDAHLKSWNSLEHYRIEHSVAAHMYAINSVSISPNNDYFVTGSMDKSIKVWDLETFKLLKVIDKSRHAGHGTSVNKVLWTDYKKQVLSCSDDRLISVWDLDFNFAD